MHWLRFCLLVLASGTVVSMTDWFFAGDWIHRRWTYPEVWRTDESRAIALTSPLPFVTAAVFIAVVNALRLHSTVALIKFAIAVWVIGPLPLVLTNAAFIKLHRVFVASYAVGWLVKLAVIAATVALFGQG